jgi:alpha-beta hydrolase superfamily lysophospholipase
MADEDLELQILGADPEFEIDGARRVTIRTTRGPIRLVMHAAANPGGVALCVSGALGGLDGPSKLYPRLGIDLPALGLSIARVDYRAPNDFNECLLDTMAGLAFARALGHKRAALIGHSFGGAVAINAGTLDPMVKTVISISSQLAGAHVVADLAPRPLLLIHGTADTILSCETSKMLYERAQEPKTIKLFEGADHRLGQCAEEMIQTAEAWLIDQLKEPQRNETEDKR